MRNIFNKNVTVEKKIDPLPLRRKKNYLYSKAKIKDIILFVNILWSTELESGPQCYRIINYVHYTDLNCLHQPLV